MKRERYKIRSAFFSDLLKKHCSTRMLSGVEVGVYKGDFSHEFVKQFKRINMYLVDPYIVHLASDRHGDQRAWDSLYFKVCKKLLNTRCAILRMTSREAAAVFPNNLDWVFIDADHEYKCVYEDMELWDRKVIPGGIVSGHDFARKRGAGDVMAAVTDYANKYRRTLKFGADTCWYWIK